MGERSRFTLRNHITKEIKQAINCKLLYNFQLYNFITRMDCIFCKIANEDVPSYKVYEDEKVVAFFDILPVTPGHTIVIPKQHVSDLEGLSKEDFCFLTQAVKKIGQAMLDGLKVKGYSIYLDNKSAANQHVPHVHFHVVPRAEGDGLERWPQSGYNDGDAEKYLKKIKKEIK